MNRDLIYMWAKLQLASLSIQLPFFFLFFIHKMGKTYMIFSACYFETMAFMLVILKNVQWWPFYGLCKLDGLSSCCEQSYTSIGLFITRVCCQFLLTSVRTVYILLHIGAALYNIWHWWGFGRYQQKYSGSCTAKYVSILWTEKLLGPKISQSFRLHTWHIV